MADEMVTPGQEDPMAGDEAVPYGGGLPDAGTIETEQSPQGGTE